MENDTQPHEHDLQSLENDIKPLRFDRQICLKLGKAISHLDKNGFKGLSCHVYISSGGSVDYSSFNIDNQYLSPGAGMLNRPFTADKNFGEFLDEILGDIHVIVEDDESEFTDDDNDISLNIEFFKQDDGTWSAQSHSTISVQQEENEEEELTLDSFIEDGDAVYLEVIEFLKAHNVDSLTWSFQGGGDNGSLEGLSFEYDGDHEDLLKIMKDTQEFAFESEDEKGESFHNGLESYLYKRLDNIGDWVNNDGGSGNVTIYKDGTYFRDTSYYYYEDEDFSPCEDIILETPIDPESKKKWLESELTQ